MDFSNVVNRVNVVQDLLREIQIIAEVISKEPTMGAINDWASLQRFKEKLLSLQDFIFTENYFSTALEEMKASAEDERLIAPLEKNFRVFLEEILLMRLNIFVEVATSWTFESYQARNFKYNMREKIKALRAWYKEHYDL